MKYMFRLYVAGRTPRSVSTIEQVRSFLERRYAANYELLVIDVLKDPFQAVENKVLATPTLVRVHPKPCKRVMGSFQFADTLLSAIFD